MQQNCKQFYSLKFERERKERQKKLTDICREISKSS